MLATSAPPSIQDTTLPSVSLATLRALVPELEATYPQAGARVEHAALIVLFRRVERSGSGAWYVQSETDRDIEYIVAGGQCTCQDYQRRRHRSPCKHLLATQLYQRLERAETEAMDPTPTASTRVDAVVDVRGEPIPYVLTPQALALLDEERQRNAARCPECGWFKPHGDLYCCGDYCDGERLA